MNGIVISPKSNKESAQKLALALNFKWENPYDTENRNFSNYNTVFNYGTTCNTKVGDILYNKSKEVKIAVDKLDTFAALHDYPFVVPWTVLPDVAKNWLDKDKCVIGRTIINGGNGEGISYIYKDTAFESIPVIFYTRYIKHVMEIRVNLWKGVPITVYKKDDVDGTWVFSRMDNVLDNLQLVDYCKKIYDKIPLDFCGIDFLVDKGGNLTFLEVNSAPILHKSTLNKLVDLINGENT